MNSLRPRDGPDRAELIEALRHRIATDGFPRTQMLFIVSVAGGVAYLGSIVECLLELVRGIADPVIVPTGSDALNVAEPRRMVRSHRWARRTLAAAARRCDVISARRRRAPGST